MYGGRTKHMNSEKGNMKDYNYSPEHEEKHGYNYHASESFNDKQTERDWDRRSNRDRTPKGRSADYYAEEGEDRNMRYGFDSRSKYSQKSDFKRYSGNGEKRVGREESDRRGYYDLSPRSRDTYEFREMNSSKDRRSYHDLSPRSRESYDFRDSRDGREMRRREYRDRSSRDQDGKEGRNFRSSRDRSMRDRDRRDSRTHDRDYDSSDRMDRHDDRERRKDDGSPDYDHYDSSDHHSGRGNSSYVSGESRYGGDSDSYKNQAPNNTVMIRGLAQHITENDIRQDILQCGLMPKDIRLIRKKDTGASRGFAFVEFNTLQEASRWMEMKQGVLMLQDQYRAVMHFSIPKEPSFDRTVLKSVQDWHCIKCGAHNFKRRDTCFKCHASRQESEKGGEGSDEVSSHPTHTVLLRNLDVLSTEDSVLQAIKGVSYSPIRSIRIGQDSLTNTSRGVCYIEMNNVMDAMDLLDALCSEPFMVDGRKVLVSYCKLPQNSSIVVQRSASESGSSWHPSADQKQYTAEDIPRLAEYFASLYAHSPQEHAHYVQYYTQYYQNQLAQAGSITLPSQTQTDSVNAAAAVAQSAIQQVQAAKEIKKQIEDPRQGKEPPYKKPHIVAQPGVTAFSPTSPPNLSLDGSTAALNVPFVNSPVHGAAHPTYPVPDVSTYQYDENSGYYYDTQTGLYYDASTQYYYNTQTQQFLYWDAEKQTYLPGPQSSTDDSSTKDDGKKGKDKERQDKVKVAKKIAKDMERWAKTLNQKKDTARQNVTLQPVNISGKSVGAADAGFAILERKDRIPCDIQVPFSKETDDGPSVSPPQVSAPSTPGLVAAYGGGSDSDEEIVDVLQEEKQHTNWIKLACLLCKRQFPSKESLIRHQQLSDLHKQNLENWYRIRGLDPNDPQQRNNKYRDRAKERRMKFGESNPPHPNRLKEKYLRAREEAVSTSYEEPTKAGIGAENVGNKLLQKMGWQEGMGLGKSNQGRTSIIQTEHRMSTAGLGAKDSTYTAQPGESYKDCVKKMMFARYHELTEQEQQKES